MRPIHFCKSFDHSIPLIYCRLCKWRMENMYTTRYYGRGVTNDQTSICCRCQRTPANNVKWLIGWLISCTYRVQWLSSISLLSAIFQYQVQVNVEIRMRCSYVLLLTCHLHSPELLILFHRWLINDNELPLKTVSDNITLTAVKFTR